MRYAQKKSDIRVATEIFAKTCNILKKRRNLSLCELAEEPFFTVEIRQIVWINEMRAMGFEIRPFYALPVPFPASRIFQTCNDFNRIYIHHVGNIQDDGKRKPKTVAPVLGHLGRRNRPSFGKRVIGTHP